MYTWLLVVTVAVVLYMDRFPPKPNDGGALSIIDSTPKIPLVEQYLPGIVDQLIDYKTRSVKHKVPRASSYNAYDWDMDKGDSNGPDRS
ncbi:unnamed protein product [Clonostachys chloroleuca]|uniref:Uncharacterized protein n=1 Tax=Clonostachys chloroleuca TaxID=1926264 RepID=A0AA35QEV3_9HYPO|nr:unnamed protein product [Clonostachys chloroleuca]